MYMSNLHKNPLRPNINTVGSKISQTDAETGLESESGALYGVL